MSFIIGAVVDITIAENINVHIGFKRLHKSMKIIVDFKAIKLL